MPTLLMSKTISLTLCDLCDQPLSGSKAVRTQTAQESRETAASCSQTRSPDAVSPRTLLRPSALAFH